MIRRVAVDLEELRVGASSFAGGDGGGLAQANKARSLKLRGYGCFAGCRARIGRPRFVRDGFVLVRAPNGLSPVSYGDSASGDSMSASTAAGECRGNGRLFVDVAVDGRSARAPVCVFAIDRGALIGGRLLHHMRLVVRLRRLVLVARRC